MRKVLDTLKAFDILI